jgi:hypothetical protein
VAYLLSTHQLAIGSKKKMQKKTISGRFKFSYFFFKGSEICKYIFKVTVLLLFFLLFVVALENV